MTVNGRHHELEYILRKGYQQLLDLYNQGALHENSVFDFAIDYDNVMMSFSEVTEEEMSFLATQLESYKASLFKSHLPQNEIMDYILNAIIFNVRKYYHNRIPSHGWNDMDLQDYPHFVNYYGSLSSDDLLFVNDRLRDYLNIHFPGFRLEVGF